MNEDKRSIVPPQRTGKDIQVEKSVTADTETDAHELFEKAKNRLLDVNNWDTLIGKGAEFEVVNGDGMPEENIISKGNYLKIDVPGPGSVAGNGYDWVWVEDIQQEENTHNELVGFRVRPSQNPQSETSATAHFYSTESTSTFIVERHGSTVRASVYDRNTKPNRKTDTLTDRIRDEVVAKAGLNIFSRIQWNNLVTALLKQ
jgi:hypothetical protein